MDDPLWPRASDWLRLSPQDFQTVPRLGVIGVPLSRSVTPGKCHLGPAAIRAALARFSLFDCDNQIDLRMLAARDFGDVDLGDNAPEEALNVALPQLQRPADCYALLGGDNGITRIGVHSLGLPLDRVGLLTFDAHHDVRDLSEGLHNGNIIRALLNEGLPGSHVVQIGIQPFTNSPDYAAFARDAGISVETIEEVHARGIEVIVSRALARLASAEAIYVDLDLDCLDRAYSPATPGSRPGGLAPWMVRKAARMCGAAPKVRAMDLTELDPSRDFNETTALAAASFLLAFASGLATRFKS